VVDNVKSDETETVTLAGRYCESGDVLITDIELPRTNPGNIICIFATGAYNYSMASNYNRIPRPGAVLVHEGKSDVIIKRETFEDLVTLDKIPERLSCKV